MGCKTCKQKKEKVTQKESINSIGNPLKESIAESGVNNGVFIYKLFAFIVVIISLPILLVVLVLQIFYFFFFPKKLEKITLLIRNFIKRTGKKYSDKQKEKEKRRREKQFKDNRGYEENSELVNVVDVEVHENNN